VPNATEKKQTHANFVILIISLFIFVVVTLPKRPCIQRIHSVITWRHKQELPRCVGRNSENAVK